MLIPLLALTQVVTAGAWTLAGLESDINAKLKTLEASVDSTKQTLIIKSISPQVGSYNDWGYSALVVYEIVDK